MRHLLPLILLQDPCSDQHIQRIIDTSPYVLLILVDVRPLKIKWVQTQLDALLLQPVDQLSGHILVRGSSALDDHIADFNR